MCETLRQNPLLMTNMTLRFGGQVLVTCGGAELGWGSARDTVLRGALQAVEAGAW